MEIAVIITATFFLLVPGVTCILVAAKAGEICTGNKTEGLLTVVGIFGMLWCAVFVGWGVWSLVRLAGG